MLHLSRMSRFVRMVHKHNLNHDYNTALGWSIDNPRKAARKKKHDDAYEPMTNALAVKHFANKRKRITFRKMDAIIARDTLFLAKDNGFIEEVSYGILVQMPELDSLENARDEKVLRVTDRGRTLISRPFGFLTMFMEKYGYAITFITGGAVIAFLAGLCKAALALFDWLF